MIITNIRYTGIVVSGMARSLPFYRDLLGMEVWADFKNDIAFMQSRTGIPGANIWMVKLKAADGVLIKLLQYLSHPQASPDLLVKVCDVGYNHIALQVSDIDALYENLKATLTPRQPSRLMEAPRSPIAVIPRGVL